MDTLRTSANEVLARVNLCTSELFEAAGDHLRGDMVLLVGSLAQGYGHRLSDIDVHVIRRQIDESNHNGIEHGDWLCFVKGRPIDIRYYRPDYIDRRTELCRGDTVSLRLGNISLNPSMRPAEVREIVRWHTGIRLSGELFTNSAASMSRGDLVATVARSQLSEAIRAARAASDLSKSGLVTNSVWREVRHSMIGMLCSRSGILPVGRKWQAFQLKSLEIDQDIIDKVRKIDSVVRFESALDSFGLTGVDLDFLVDIAKDRHVDDFQMAGLPYVVGKMGTFLPQPQIDAFIESFIELSRAGLGNMHLLQSHFEYSVNNTRLSSWLSTLGG
jgi:hypothetical protein